MVMIEGQRLHSTAALTILNHTGDRPHAVYSESLNAFPAWTTFFL